MIHQRPRSVAALAFFESALEKNGTGFLVGDAVTYVDLGLFIILFELAEEDNIRVERFGCRATESFESLHIRIRSKFCQNLGNILTILLNQKF